MGREIRVVSMVLHATKSFLRVDHFTTPHLKEDILGQNSAFFRGTLEKMPSKGL